MIPWEVFVRGTVDRILGYDLFEEVVELFQKWLMYRTMDHLVHHMKGVEGTFKE